MNENMSIKELLSGVEVEWKRLGEVVKIKNGKDWKKLNKGNIPVYGSGGIMAYVDTFSYDKPTVLIPRKGTITNIFYVETPFWNVDTIYYTIIDTEKFIPKFFYYYMKTIDLMALDTGSGRPSLTQAILNKIPIPIPPLKVQSEIVRILDNFTELTAELTARKKQYSYYRDKLLSFNDDEVEWKRLGEIFNLKNGYTPSKRNKEFWTNGTIPWFRMDDIRTNGRILNNALQLVTESAVKGGKLFPANSIIIATSATIGEHALITTPYLSNQRFTNLSLKKEYQDKFDIKFLFYYSFLLGEWCKSNTTMSSFASVDMNGFRRFPIPIPPIEKQKKIVSILDKFDTLTNSISEGLPKEIELRTKQYEYYRDKLLSFPKEKE